jgi:hypothetical protein
MKIVLASVTVSAFLISAIAQQNPTTSANQGIATNPTADTGGTATQPTTGVTSGAQGQAPTDASGAGAFNTVGTTNQTNVGTAPLFLNVTPTTITDANGQPIGILQQLALSPSGTINFGLVNMGGRLVPVPWQLILSGTAGNRGTLTVNTNRDILQTAPPVLMNQLPMLTQDEVAQQILNHFGLQAPANTQPTIVTTGTALGGADASGVTLTGGGNTNSVNTPRGATGAGGVTVTGGTTNTIGFNTNMAFRGTNGVVPNNTRTNQALNTTGGLLSPTGRTNGIQDGYNSGPGSTDRFGPRQNAPPTQPTPPPVPTQPPNTTGQPTGPR